MIKRIIAIGFAVILTAGCMDDGSDMKEPLYVKEEVKPVPFEGKAGGDRASLHVYFRSKLNEKKRYKYNGSISSRGGQKGETICPFVLVFLLFTLHVFFAPLAHNIQYRDKGFSFGCQ